ncbi:uncharacterized protein LOC108100289 [Drosophila ficusphila]|uniref:uncharacterized protein LOC108100289 n=1 Tax=Drosophila ficusphila TaxID=30025 RepID=UPI0007E6B0EF|nr:uncharacterized protein LOC108100289 [Drosophila ficusphila]
MILVWLILVSILFIYPADSKFFTHCNNDGTCVNEKWRNGTHYNLTCLNWMELESGEVDTCPKPWKCCHTTQYEKKIPYPKG